MGIACTFYALTHLPVAVATTLINTTPIWVAGLQSAATRRCPPLSTVMAALSGTVGVVLIYRPHLGVEGGAVCVGLGSAFCMAVAMMSLSRLGDLSPVAVVTHFSALSTCVAGLMVASAGGWSEGSSLGVDAVVTLLLVGASGTFGQLGMTRAFALGDASRVAVVGLAQVGFALLFDIVFWHRSFGMPTLLGMALVLVPVGWLLTRPAPRDEGSGGAVPS